MMTLEEISASNINTTVAREAYDQASKRLGDALDTKKAHEQKAFTLFNGYVTVSLALFGVGGAILKEHGPANLILPFWATGALFLIGAIFFVVALIDKAYGALASDPSMWLNRGTIDGDDSALGLMLAYITYHHQSRIDVSNASNRAKALRIRAGIIVGICAPLVLLLFFLIPLDQVSKALFH
jgi:hypothetical protein